MLRNMMEILRSLRSKLQETKGEVSVEWILIAVVMAIAIVAAFLPQVQTILTNGITEIGTKITNAGTAT